MTLWSGRFDTAPDPAAFDFGISFGFDRALFEDDVTGSIAWAEALAAAGVLSAADTTRRSSTRCTRSSRRVVAIRRGSPDQTKTCTASSSVSWSSASAMRAGACTPAARATSRSRSTCGCICVVASGLLQQAVVKLVAACADQAEQAGAALMPSYTHLRRAQPVLVAHFFLSHAAALRRDYARLATAANEADALTLGSGAIAGTSYAVDTDAARPHARILTRRLATAWTPRRIAISWRRSCMRCRSAMVHLSRMAEDLIIFTGEEHGFFELSDASATGSSMMPQKKNPDPLELVRGKTGRAIGRLTGWLATMKGLPSGYNKDLQEDKEAVFDAEATLRGVAGCDARRGLAARRSTRSGPVARRPGLLLATDVADYLVSRGMPFRRAHEVVGAMVRRLLAEGRDFSALTHGRMARGERDVRGGCAAGGDRAGVGSGAPHPAVDQP